MDDYQWPQPIFTDNEQYVEDKSSQERAKFVGQIEAFFKDIFGAEVILVPSGRSAVAILLRYLGINRSHTVFTPKWTSTCLFDVIGRVSNPNTIYTKDCDVAIVVHKWGQVVRFAEKPRTYLIEDSVDSIIHSQEAMFPNGGEVEIFSLPKMIGSYGGGLIAVKSKELAEKIRGSIAVNLELARHQSKLRFDSVRGLDTGFDSWLHLESANTSLDYSALAHIQKCLPNYEINRRCITRRLDMIQKTFKDISVSDGRLPPVIPLNTDSHPLKDGESVMVRHYSDTGFIDRPDYKEVYLIPLHFGVSDEYFSRIVNSFQK